MKRKHFWETWAETGHIFVSELRESFMDGGSFLIFVVAAIIYPMIYSIGYVNETIREIPVAVVDLDQTRLSRQYSRMIDATEQIHVTCKPESLNEAKELFFDGRIQGVVLISSSFEKDILRGQQGKATVYCDAGRFFVYKQVFTAASYATGIMNAGIEIRSMLQHGKMMDEAVSRISALNPQLIDLYNPSSGYATFIVPGILIIVIQQSLLVGIGLLFGKYYEQRKKLVPGDVNTISAGFRMILGRSMAYVAIYLVTSMVTLILFYHWLSFPETSTILKVYPVLIIYLFAISFMGIALAAWFRKRVHGLMFVVFLSPVVFFLCGVAWPRESLPGLVRMISYIFPTTPMLPAFLKLRVMGGGMYSIWHEVLTLVLQMAGYLLLAVISVWWSERMTSTPAHLLLKEKGTGDEVSKNPGNGTLG